MKLVITLETALIGFCVLILIALIWFLATVQIAECESKLYERRTISTVVGTKIIQTTQYVCVDVERK